jgi:hypothetical protein
VVDDIIYKAAGKESQVYMNWEKRLARIFTNSYHKLGRTAIRKVDDYLEEQTRFSGKTLKEVDRIVTREFGEWANDADTAGAIFDVLDEAYRKSFKMGTERVLGKRSELPLHTIDPDRAVGRTVTKAEIPGLGEISLADEHAIEALADQQAFWMGDFYPGKFQNGLKANAKELLIESGLSKQEAAKAFKGFLQGQFGFLPKVPEGWTGHPDDYFRNLAGNVVTVARAHGTMRSFDRLGVSKYEISNPEDEATCKICNRMVEESFSVPKAIHRMDLQVKAKSKSAAQKLHPWLSWSKIQNIPSDDLLGKGVGYPPFHYGCRCSVELADDFEIDDIVEAAITKLLRAA